MKTHRHGDSCSATATERSRGGADDQGKRGGLEGFGLIRGGRGRDFWLIDFKSESGWGVEVD